MKRGYFPLYRKIQDHPFYKEKRVFSKYEAWLDILMEAQHSEEPKEVLLGMTVHTCNYGESLKSIKTWSQRWKWSESKVRRYFEMLKKLNQIRTKSDGKTTRLTVINYSTYDPKRRDADDLPTTCRRDADDMPTTDNNDKKEKKVKNDNKKEKIIDLQTYLPKKEQPDFITPLIEKTFNDFLQHRTDIGHKVTDLAITRLINKLEKLSGGDENKALELIDNSIESNWKTFFPLKENYNSAKGKYNDAEDRLNSNIEAGRRFINGQ